ncbi:DEAD/DEAH box helicase family protein [Hyphomonas sp.]|uniref:DEAD/DEAH box helicase n=1 Tax=Hyphomonas sp. TaxID=87 RepID=UPI0037C0440A
MIHLRPRQSQAVEDLRLAYATGARAPILVAPTGFGKTATATEIVRLTVSRGRSVWFLAHLREILDDTADRLRAAGISHGSIRAGRSSDYTQLVQVVAVQTAVRRSGLPRPDLIIIDECHLAVAESYRKVIAAAGHPLLLGLTGTPQRLDGRGLGEVFDRLVLTCTTAELIDEQLLAPVRVFAPPPPDLSGLHTRAGDFDQGEASAVLSKPAVVGDALSHWNKLCVGRRGVAFCTTVAHAQAVAEQWQRAGYRAVAVHGGSDDAERREAVAGLRAGRLDLVACAQLWIAGVDVPEIDTVIWLRPTQSLTAWLQGNGRGLRIAPGKRDLLVLDHVGNCQRLGHPLEVHEWSLDGRVKRSREAALSVKVCPQCFAAMPSARQTCPDCGHQFTPERRELEHVEGELVEVQRGSELPPVGPYKKGDIVRDSRVPIITNELVVLGVHGDRLNVTSLNPVEISKQIQALGYTGFGLPVSDAVFVRRPDHKREQASATTIEDLIAIGKRRGMKNPRGWARHVMAARQAKGQWRRVA